MNERFQGWKLALALLIPIAIIGAAAWIAFQALSDDDQQVAAGPDDQAEVTPEPTATPLPETEPLAAPADVAPTPLVIPTSAPTEVPTPAPEVAETPAATAVPAPAATAVPAPAATAAPVNTPDPNAPVPTATPDPDVLAVSCSVEGGAFPTELDVDEQFGPISAVMTPAEAAANHRFSWNFGNGTIAVSPKTGFISYPEIGTYTVTLTAADTTTGAEIATQCGQIQVGEAAGSPFNVSCSAAPTDTSLEWKDATVADQITITVTWQPREAPLRLQWEFGPEDDIIIVEDDRSPNRRRFGFATLNSTAKIFWRHESGETGRIECRAFPEQEETVAPAPTATTEATPEPTATSTS